MKGKDLVGNGDVIRHSSCGIAIKNGKRMGKNISKSCLAVFDNYTGVIALVLLF